jgi:hypothetical protein
MIAVAEIGLPELADNAAFLIFGKTAGKEQDNTKTDAEKTDEDDDKLPDRKITHRIKETFLSRSAASYEICE